MVEALMKLQEKTLLLSPERSLTLKEQVIFQGGQEGLRVWECGIALARHFSLHRASEVQG